MSKYSACKVWVYCLALSLGSLQLGYAMGVYNPLSKVYMQIYSESCGDCWNLTSHAEPMNTLVSTVVFLGAFLGSVMAELFLRKRRNFAIFSFAVFCIIGAGLCLIVSLPALLIGRLIHGFGAGGFGNLAPIMINQVSPPAIRGATGVLVQTVINVGIFLAALFGLGLPHNAYQVHQSDPLWRIMTGFPAAISVIQIILFLTIYRRDTPQVYLRDGKRNEALDALEVVYSNEGALQRLSEMELEASRSRPLLENNNISASNISVNNGQGLKANVPKSLIVCALFAVFQQLTGQNSIVFYASQIFESSSDVYNISEGVRISIITTSVNLVFSFLSAFFIDRFGRKPLLYFGYSVMITFVFLTGLFELLGYTLLQQISVMFYIAGFAISMGPILWAYLPEVLNSAGLAVASVVNWIFVMVISLGTPQLKKLNEGMFFVFTATNVMGLLFVIFFIVESKGKSRAQLQDVYAGRKTDQASVKSYDGIPF